ncbi:energy transducer TonB [Colwellia piezophila]|uniref:energy transducer TonB n=1 Tax=Colwellia piezophila TaxID=211668 RepID=UPI0003778CDD|nr:energy transducer TonB [Colwellia piezophila]
MKLLSVLSLGLLMLSGCKSTPEQYLTESPITIEQSNLENYWVQEAKEFSFKFKNMKVPETGGFVNIKYLVDSNGEIFSPTVIESSPKGAWDKFALRALSNIKYVPSKANPSNTPVYVITEFTFGQK